MNVKNRILLEKIFKKTARFISQNKKKSSAVAFLLLLSLFSQILAVNPLNITSFQASLSATASFLNTDQKDLVIVLAEEEILNSSQNYTTDLDNKYSGLGNDTIRDRIERYTDDIQSNLSGKYNNLDIAIISIAKNQTPAQIASLLKQAYFQNLKTIPNAKLQGLVIFGEVPLPVVNKNGNRFVSMYPYTDFVDSQYLYDDQSGFFQFQHVNDPEPEVWHGLIDISDPQDLAIYLDKNHLHYRGEADFADFEKKIFFSEPQHDFKSFNQDLYAQYQTYLTILEEFAYNRFSRNLITLLENSGSSLQLGQSQSNQQIKQPDVFTKPIIEKYITEITDVFSVALRDQQEAIAQTGRYTEGDYISGLQGVARVDELSSLYLKEVNDLIESELVDILEEVQVDIPLLKGSVLTPIIQSTDQNGNTTNQQLDEFYFVNHSRSNDVTQLYLGLVPGGADSFLGLPTDQIIDRLFIGNLAPLGQEVLINTGDLRVQGVDVSKLNSPTQCRLYRGGGTLNPLDKTVRTHRGQILDREADPIQGNAQPVCYNPYNPDGLEKSWEKIEGPSGLFNQGVNTCTAFSGQNLQDLYRTDEVQLDFQSHLTHEACSGMRLAPDYLSLLKLQYSSFADPNQRQSKLDQLNGKPDYSNLQIAPGLSLQEILTQIPTYQSLSLDGSTGFDWHAFSSQILNNPAQTRFQIASPTSAIENLILDIDQISSGKSVSSLIIHADPSPGMISKAYEVGNTDLPINATRFATFMDSRGQKQQVVFPNTFKISSIPQLRQELKQLEDLLTSISPNQANYQNRLQDLISGQEDSFQNQTLTQSNQSKLRFLIDWKNFDLNQKYLQVHEQILDPSNTIELDNIPKTFEIAHITSSTSDSGLDFNILDFQSFSPQNQLTQEFRQNFQEQQKREKISAQTTIQKDSVNLFEYFTDYLPSWYDEQQQRVSSFFQPQASELTDPDEVFKSYEQLQQEAESQQNQSMKASISAGQSSVNSQQGVTLTVEISQEGQIVDSSKPLISFSNSALARLVDQNPNQGLASIHTYQILPLTKSGELEITVSSQNKNIEPQKFTLQINPGPAQNINFKQTSTKLTPDQVTEVELTLTDEFNNPSFADISNLPLTFDEPSKLQNPPSQVTFQKGKATLDLKPNPQAFGNVYMQIEGQGLLSSFHKLTLNTELSLQALEQIELNSLILNLFLDKNTEETKQTINQILLNSKAQNVSALTTSLVSNQPILHMHPTGAIEQLPSSITSISTQISPSQISISIDDNQNNKVADLTFQTAKYPLSLVQAEDNQFYLDPLVENTIQQEAQEVKFENQVIFTLNQDQTINTINPGVSIASIQGQRPAFILSLDNQPIAELSIISNDPNLVTIQPNSRNPQVSFQAAHTMSNSNFPLGFTFFNTKLDISPDMLPSSSDIRAEDFINQERVGLKQGSKLLHLLSSESIVGEANRPHLSEAGVVYGDPAISLPFRAPKKLSSMNFNDALGEYIGRNSTSSVVDIVSIQDSNQTFIAYQNGQVSLYNHTQKSFIKNYLKVPNGIKQVKLANLQKDTPYLAFLTDRPCFSDDSCVYIFNPSNDQPKFGITQNINPNQDPQQGIELDRDKLSTLNRLDLETGSKPTQILFQDMNQDDLDDLLVVSQDQILSLFWNQKGDIQSVGSTVGHTRIPFQDGEISTNDTLISGLAGSESDLQTTPLNFPAEEQVVTTVTQTFNQTTQSQIISNSNSVQFANLNSVPSLQGSTLQIQDINGQTLQNNDTLRYTLTLNNNSLNQYTDLSISIPVNSNLQVDPSSLSPSNLSLIQTSNSGNRPFVIRGLSLAPNTIQQIILEFTYNRPENQDPSMISIAPSQKENEFPVQDGYPDIQVITPGNPDQTFFYSDFDKSSNTLKFRRFTQSPPQSTTNTAQNFLNQFTDQQGQPINPSNASDDEKENFAKTLSQQTLDRDADNDGIVDVYDSSPSNSLQQAGSKIEGAIKDLTCDGGGCLAVPFNNAFLVPDKKAPGTDLPVFGWGCPPGPFIPPTWPPVAHQSCSGGRIYVSPTLTGEFAGSVCVGPYLAGQCFTFNMFDLGELCQTINQKVQDTIQNAKDFVQNEGGGVITVGDNSSQNQQSNINIPGFPKVITDWIANQWEEVQNKLLDPPDISIVYPDPDSLVGLVTPVNSQEDRRFLFTDPYPECLSEDIFNSTPEKCGNLSTYTDVLNSKQNAKSKASFNGVQDIKSILEEIALMPLFDINYETVYITYPWINEDELTKYSLQIDKVWDQFKAEIFVTGTSWGCFTDLNYQGVSDIQKALDEGTFLQSIASVSNKSPQVQAACVRLAAGFEGIDLNIKENLQRVKEYREIPKNIFKVENFIANYTDQVLQYAELILQRTLGWLTENTNNLLQWEQTVLEIEGLVDDLKLLLDFSVDYMESCDDCRSNRTNTDGVQGLLELFVNLSPDLPIIEVPSFPDITLDVSNIQAGVDITLPDIQFKKDPITLPNLDLKIDLPEVPSATINLEGNNFSGQGINLEAYLEGFEIPVLPAPPNIDTVTIFQDLPELPELEIPELPSLPKPPSISQFTSQFTETISPTVETLSTVTRIYCLITKGLVPIPELELKSQIETMTNRPLTPVLPVDIGFQLPKPELEGQYIDEIIFKLTTQLNLELPQIQEQTQKLADQLNSFTTNIADELEQSLQENTELLRQELSVPSEEFNSVIENQDLNVNISGDLTSFEDLSDRINKLSQLSKDINNSFQGDLYLEAKTQKLKDLDLPANRSIASIDQYNSHPLVQKNKQKIQKANLVASTAKVPNEPVIRNQNFKFKSHIAQSTPQPSSLRASTTFNPQTGVFVIDQDNNIQPLIAYSTPSEVNSKVDILDADNDGDQDVVYTIEDQIFFKQNQSVLQADGASNTKAKLYEFTDFLSDLAPIESVSFSNIQPVFSHNKLNFQLPLELIDETLVLDTYVYTSIDTLKEHIRYVITNDLEAQIQSQDFSQIITIPNTPNISLNLSNGSYIGELGIKTGERISILQTNINLNPNTCGDSNGPSISIDGGLTQQVPLFGNFQLDASQTTDLESELISLFIDNDLATDSNNDGNLTNDPNLQGSQNLAATQFVLGPFNELTTEKYQINAEDINGNKSQVTLTLEVVAPEMRLTQSNQDTFISQLDPISGNIPVTFVRQRDGIISRLGTSNTDSKGQAKLTTSNQSNSLIIKDSNSKPIFRINENTGAVQVIDPQAELKVNPWIEGQQNTSIELVYQNIPLTKVQKVSDPAFIPVITDQELSSLDLETREGITIQDTSPSNEWQTSLLENNLLIYNNTPDSPSVIVTSDGQINLLDSAIELEVSEITSIQENQWFQLYADSTLQFNLHVGIIKDIVIQEPSSIDQETSTPTETIDFDPSTITKTEFQDIDDSNPNKEAIDRLQDLGIIQGVKRDGVTFFEPNRQLQRDEYSKIILEALCLAPSPQSFQQPQVFDDIPFSQNLPWFYSYTKETQLLGLFNGYLGEINPQTSLPPFKPAQSITVAEASKVILEALELKGVIQFTIPPDFPGPWYAPYIQLSQDITNFVTPQTNQRGDLKSNFLLTTQEAAQPNKLVTREEFAVIASRVLDIYNCFEIEGEQSNPDIPEPDTQPQPPSTSVELTFPSPSKPGIYIDDIACNMCPCRYTLDFEDDIIDNDTIFSLILGPNQEVYSQSNILTIQR